MRKLFFLFIVLLKLGALAQTKFDYISCQKVLIEKLAAIQLKIWNGVMEGKLTPYDHCSDREISIREVRKITQGVDTTENQRGGWGDQWSSSHGWSDDSAYFDNNWKISTKDSFFFYSPVEHRKRRGITF